MTLGRTGIRHPHTGELLTPVGYRKDGRPILPILGAGPDDDDGDEEIEIDDDKPDDDDGDDDEYESDDEDDVPFVKEDGKPFTKKDYDALQLALRNARQAERKARRGTRDGKDGGKDGDKDGGKDVERVRAEAESAAVATWKPLLVNQAARAALVEAGLIGKPDRLLRLIDLDEIDVDPETGELDGLDEQIEDMRKDYGSLFRKRGGARRIDAGDKDRRERGGKKMSATELQAAALLGDI